MGDPLKDAMGSYGLLFLDLNPDRNCGDSGSVLEKGGHRGADEGERICVFDCVNMCQGERVCEHV